MHANTNTALSTIGKMTSDNDSVDGDSQQTRRVASLAAAFGNILEFIGEDPSRQGLLKTPIRAAESILHLTKGYRETVAGSLTFHHISPHSRFSTRLSYSLLKIVNRFRFVVQTLLMVPYSTTKRTRW